MENFNQFSCLGILHTRCLHIRVQDANGPSGCIAGLHQTNRENSLIYEKTLYIAIKVNLTKRSLTQEAKLHYQGWIYLKRPTNKINWEQSEIRRCKIW